MRTRAMKGQTRKALAREGKEKTLGDMVQNKQGYDT